MMVTLSINEDSHTIKHCIKFEYIEAFQIIYKLSHKTVKEFFFFFIKILNKEQSNFILYHSFNQTLKDKSNFYLD